MLIFPTGYSEDSLHQSTQPQPKEPLGSPLSTPTERTLPPAQGRIQILRRPGKEPEGLGTAGKYTEKGLGVDRDKSDMTSPAVEPIGPAGSQTGEAERPTRCTLDVALQCEIAAWKVYKEWLSAMGTETSFFEWATHFGVPQLVHQRECGHLLRQPLQSYVAEMPVWLSTRSREKQSCSRCGWLRRCRSGPAWIGKGQEDPTRVRDARFCAECIPDAEHCHGRRRMRYVDGTYLPGGKDKRGKSKRGSKAKNPSVYALDRMLRTPHRKPTSSESSSSSSHSSSDESSDSSGGDRSRGGYCSSSSGASRRRRRRARAKTPEVMLSVGGNRERRTPDPLEGAEQPGVAPKTPGILPSDQYEEYASLKDRKECRSEEDAFAKATRSIQEQAKHIKMFSGEREAADDLAAYLIDLRRFIKGNAMVRRVMESGTMDMVQVMQIAVTVSIEAKSILRRYMPLDDAGWREQHLQSVATFKEFAIEHLIDKERLRSRAYALTSFRRKPGEAPRDEVDRLLQEYGVCAMAPSCTVHRRHLPEILVESLNPDSRLVMQVRNRLVAQDFVFTRERLEEARSSEEQVLQVMYKIADVMRDELAAVRSLGGGAAPPSYLVTNRSRNAVPPRRLEVYRSPQPLAAVTEQRPPPAPRGALGPSRGPVTFRPHTAEKPLPQRPGNPAYTGCHNCKSVEHLMRDCPGRASKHLKLLCAIGKQVMEDEAHLDSEMGDKLRVDYGDDICAVVEQGIPEGEEFLPASPRGHLLNFVHAIIEDVEEEEAGSGQD